MLFEFVLSGKEILLSPLWCFIVESNFCFLSCGL
jgi:hypothetical protein